MMNTQPEASGKTTLRSPEPGNSKIYVGGTIHSYLVNSSEAEGSLTVIRFVARPGCEPPAHVHHHEHEVFYVLEGEIEFFVEGEPKSFYAGPGDTVHLPRERAHVFVFQAPEVCAMTVIHAVNGHRTCEPYLKTMALGAAESMQMPDNDKLPKYKTMDAAEMKQAMELAEQYGVTFLTPQQIGERLPLFQVQVLDSLQQPI